MDIIHLIATISNHQFKFQEVTASGVQEVITEVEVVEEVGQTLVVVLMMREMK